MCLIVTVMAGGLALQSAAADADALSWSPGVVVTPPANAGADPDVVLTSLSCPSAGSCTAVGSYQDATGETQGLMATESGGRWNTAAETQLPSNAYTLNPDVSLVSVSCATAGNCTAVGSFLDTHGFTQGLLLTETSGSWGAGREVIHPLNVSVATNPLLKLTFVSCATASYCLAAGSYSDSDGHPEGMLETEINGVWSQTEKNGSWSYTGTEASLPADAAAQPNVALTSGSCGAVGSCVAVGTYLNSSHGQEGLLLSGNESGGAWTFTPSTANPPGASSPSVSLNSVSCAAAGQCDAVGSYEDPSDDVQGLLLTQAGGTWAQGTAAVLPGDASTDPDVSLSSVSCPSAGNCDAVGDYYTGVGSVQGLMLTETARSWQDGAEPMIPTDAGSTQFVTLSSVSCAAADACAATGNYADDSFYSHPLLLSQSPDGSWSAGIEPALSYVDSAPNAYVEAVSCATGGDCSAVADYTDQAGSQLAGAVNGTVSPPAGTSLSLGAPPATIESGFALPAADFSAALSGGASESGTVTFTVFGPQSSPPASCGYGGTTIGTATVSGNGNYDSPSGFAPSSPGDYWWYSSYSGDLGNTSAVSPCGALMDETDVQTPAVSVDAPLSTVLHASISPSAVAASLSGVSRDAGGTVTFTVFGPQSLPPTACTIGGTALSAASVDGDGSLTPSVGFTPPAVGDYWWYADYSGDASDPDAVSGCGSAMTETVVKAVPTLSLTMAPATGTAEVPLSSAASATLTGGVGETGTVTFSVFGPQTSPPVSCASPTAVVGTATVGSDGTYGPVSTFTPSAAGTYWWYATYSGDATNQSAVSVCGSQMLRMVVSVAAVTPTPPVASTRIVKVTPSGDLLMVTLTCDGSPSQSCVNTVTVTVPEPLSPKAGGGRRSKLARERVVTIGTGKVKLAGGASRRVSIRLNRTGTELLKSRGKLTAVLRLRQGDAVLSRTVILRAAAAAKRRRSRG